MDGNDAVMMKTLYKALKQIYQQQEEELKQQQKVPDHSKTPLSFLTAESIQSSQTENEADADDFKAFELEEMETVMLQSLEDSIKRHWRGIAATTSSNFLANIE